MKVKDLKELLNKFPDTAEIKIYRFEIEDTQGGNWEKQSLDKNNIEYEKDILIIS